MFAMLTVLTVLRTVLVSHNQGQWSISVTTFPNSSSLLMSKPESMVSDVRIPGHGDHRSEVMAIAIPK